MELIFIEIPPGRDVVEYLINLARSQQAGIIVMSGSGLVSDVTILPPVTRAIDCSVDGQYNMISLMGTYVNPNIVHASPSLLSIASSHSYFSIFVSGGDQGQVFGGIVAGKIMTAGFVKITAALIKKPEYHRLGNIDESIPKINKDRFEHECKNFTNTFD